MYLDFPKPHHFDTVMKNNGIQHWCDKFQRGTGRKSAFRLSTCMVNNYFSQASEAAYREFTSSMF